MKLRLPLVLAHVRKDFLALRVMFLLWAAYMALDVVGMGFYLGGGMSYVKNVTDSLPGFTLLFYIQFILPYALIIGVIQEDPLMEPDAFWRTRPLSRPELLAAKTAIVAALAVVSFAVWSGLMLVQPHFHAVTTPLSFKGGSWVFLLALVAMASVTPTFIRLVVTAIGMSLGIAFLAFPLKLALHGTATPLFAGHPRSGEWVLGFLAIGFAAIIAHQYLTLRTKVSLALIGLLLIAAVLLG